MKIDDENKVVWCSDANDLAFANNKTTLELIEQLIKFDGSYSLCELQDNYFDSDNEKKVGLLHAVVNGYGFELEQPQKYYWRKKKEHLAWFEDFESILVMSKNNNVLRFGCISSYDNRFFEGTFTERQARDLLKDDFDKFEKVECD